MKQGVVVLMVLLVTSGCARLSERALIHPHAAVSLPTFCFYRESLRSKIPKRHHHSKPIAIERLEVYRYKPYDEQFEWGDQWFLPIEQEAWVAQYLPDPILEPLNPFSCITYGKLPPGYREKAPALPLVPERFYLVYLRSKPGVTPTPLSFIIRLGPSGEPIKLEYIDGYSWLDTILVFSSSGKSIKSKDKQLGSVQTIPQP